MPRSRREVDRPQEGGAGRLLLGQPVEVGPLLPRGPLGEVPLERELLRGAAQGDAVDLALPARAQALADPALHLVVTQADRPATGEPPPPQRPPPPPPRRPPPRPPPPPRA